MIIAIDETGDFAPDSPYDSFFVAVFIDQANGNLELKHKQFKAWLDTIPKEKFSVKGEVKGSDLSEAELLSFVMQVYQGKPHLSHAVVCFKPLQNPFELMAKFKEIEVAKLVENIRLATDDGKHEMAKQYEQMSYWYRNAKKMHYQHYFKIVLLNKLVNRSIREAVGKSIVAELLEGDKEAFNLTHLQIKIDQDFIRGDEPVIYWKELLRNEFIRQQDKEGIPALDSWKDDHPFLQKYGNGKPGQLDFKDLFQNNCEFLDSHDSFEIQIADIVAIIYNRYFNRKKCVAAYAALFYNRKKIVKPLCIVLNSNIEAENKDRS